MAKTKQQFEGLIERLSEKSHEELLALLEQLLQRQPDIEPLVEMLMELPLASSTQEEHRPGAGKSGRGALSR